MRLAKHSTRSPSCSGSPTPGSVDRRSGSVPGTPHAVPFTFAQIKTKAHLGGKVPRTKAAKTAPIAGLDPHFLFSFSGIKTAVLRYVELHAMRDEATARIPRMLAAGHPPQTKEAALELCPQAHARPHRQLSARRRRRPDEEDIRSSRVPRRNPYSGHRRRSRQPGAARAFHRRSGATRNSNRIPDPCALHRQRCDDCGGGMAGFVAGQFAPSDLSADPSLALGR